MRLHIPAERSEAVELIQFNPRYEVKLDRVY